MTNIAINLENAEQIKNNTNISKDICNKFRIFLEKDNFEIVKSKSGKLLESKTADTNSKIEKLKDLQLRSDKAITRLDETLKKKITQNKKLKESIMLRLNQGVKK
jgi:hypothetical protein